MKEKMFFAILILLFGLITVTGCQEAQEIEILPTISSEKLTLFTTTETSIWETRIVVDSSDIPTVLFLQRIDTYESIVRYARIQDATWEVETIDSSLTGQLYPLWAGLAAAVDTSGNLHVLVRSGSYGRTLKHLYQSGSSWAVEDITTEASGYYGNSSIKYDAANNLHVVFQDDQSKLYMHASREGANVWTINEIANAVGGELSNPNITMAMNSSIYPHIIYTKYPVAGNTHIMYGYHSGSAWVIEQIATVESNPGVSLSLQIDSSGNPHVAYSHAVQYELHYLVKQDGNWQSETFTEAGPSSAMVLGASNTPKIAYHKGSETGGVGPLRFAEKTASGWEKSNLDTDIYFAKYGLSMVLDSLFVPHLCGSYSYADAGNGIIYYKITE
jgi:hypothetical protein